MHKLTVDGQEYFFPSPVSTLKVAILEAVRSGGAYVSVPSLQEPSDLEILFSWGTSVAWTSFELEPPSDYEPDEAFTTLDFDV